MSQIVKMANKVRNNNKAKQYNMNQTIESKNSKIIFPCFSRTPGSIFLHESMAKTNLSFWILNFCSGICYCLGTSALPFMLLCCCSKPDICTKHIFWPFDIGQTPKDCLWEISYFQFLEREFQLLLEFTCFLNFKIVRSIWHISLSVLWTIFHWCCIFSLLRGKLRSLFHPCFHLPETSTWVVFPWI